MSAKINAAEQIRTFAGMFKPLVEAADLLQNIGSLEQATAEAEAGRKAANDDRDKAVADLQRVKADTADAVSQLAERAAVENMRAKQVVEEAEEKAAMIVSAAEERAAGILKSGQDQASEALAKNAQQLSAMQAKLTELTNEANAAIVRRDQAEASAVEAEGRLVKAQAAIRKLAGL